MELKSDLDTAAKNGGKEGLSEKELEVLKLTASGYNIKQLCVKLGADENTVETYRKNIMAKTNTRCMTDAVDEGTKKGWIYI